MGNKLAAKQLLLHLCLSIPFACSLLWGLHIEWRLSFCDRWQRIISHFVIKLILRGLEKDLFLGKWVALYSPAFNQVEQASPFWFSKWWACLSFSASPPWKTLNEKHFVLFYLWFRECLPRFNSWWCACVWALAINSKNGLLKIIQLTNPRKCSRVICWYFYWKEN